MSKFKLLGQKISKAIQIVWADLSKQGVYVDSATSPKAQKPANFVGYDMCSEINFIG